MSHYQAVISDLDGTLINTLEANVLAYGDAFRDAGLSFPEDTYRKNFGLRFDRMAELLAPGATPEQLRLIKDQKQLHYARHYNKTVLNKRLLGDLKAHRSNGAILGLATTASRHNAEALLTFYGLQDFFDAYLYGEDVAHGKPNPECYQKIIQLLNANPRTSLVYEDSMIGRRAAEAAGAHVMMVDDAS